MNQLQGFVCRNRRIDFIDVINSSVNVSVIISLVSVVTSEL